MNLEIEIGSHIISEDSVFIIAEAGVNHNGDINIAKKLIEEAKNAGADAVKFQTFISEEVISHNTPKASYQTVQTGSDESQLEMVKKFEFPPEVFSELQDYANDQNILFLSTPFDFKSIRTLERINVPAYKISSTDITNLPFLTEIAKLDKPIILSTGMSTIEEVGEAVSTISKLGNENLILLHCTSSYPAPIDELNLRAISTLKKEFNCIVGYSDHSLGLLVPPIAVALGANVIEKHFTLDKKMNGPDHAASLEPIELKKMVKLIRQTQITLGDGIKRITMAESDVKKVAQKSIITQVKITRDTKLTREMLAIKRPGTGILPKHFEKLIGKLVNCDVPKDTVLEWKMIKNEGS